jgi:hypothetical protein
MEKGDVIVVVREEYLPSVVRSSISTIKGDYPGRGYQCTTIAEGVEVRRTT